MTVKRNKKHEGAIKEVYGKSVQVLSEDVKNPDGTHKASVRVFRGSGTEVTLIEIWKNVEYCDKVTGKMLCGDVTDKVTVTHGETVEEFDRFVDAEIRAMELI